jgi:hypothetical protein
LPFNVPLIHMADRDAKDEQAIVRRILRESDSPHLLDVLSEELSGSDLTSLLLEVIRQRASRLSPDDVLRQYRRDRFVAPAEAGFASLRGVQDAMLRALPDDVEVLTLSPLAPVGTHSAVASVDQNRVVATIRGTDVAADPTNALALEAAVRRRRHLASAATRRQEVQLAAFQRVTRAQHYREELAFSHFELFGLVTAGRALADRRFEQASATAHLRIVTDALLNAGADRVHVELTDFGAERGELTAAIRRPLSPSSAVEVTERPDRTEGRGYYPGFCYKARAVAGDRSFEVADGGHVDWTQRLLHSKKERLMITGVSVDRLAHVTVDAHTPRA